MVWLLASWMLCQSVYGGDAADRIQAGPMLGYAEKTEVMVWLQTTEPAVVHVRYWKKGLPAHSWMTEPIRTEKINDLIAHIRVTDLENGQAYEYEVWVNYQQAVIDRPLQFRTQKLWEHRTDPPDFSVAVGSCAYVNQDSVDRPGSLYGGHYGIFQAMASKHTDVMVWLGDNTYLREVDWYSWSGILHRNRHTRALKELQPLLSGSHHYATWDDHDFGPNNSDRSFSQKYKALEAFNLYWPNPTSGLPDAPGVFFQFRWSDVDFFMLDNRFHRSPYNEIDSPAKTMLGKVQLAWLKDALLYSRANFKVIVCGSQMINTFSKFESFNQFTFEREDLLAFIRANNITGVLFLSGDRHHTELLKLEDKKFYPLYDFTSSPLTSAPHAPGDELNNRMRVAGTFVHDRRNFGVLRFSGPLKDRKVELETYDEEGLLLWNYVIAARELKPKSAKTGDEE